MYETLTDRALLNPTRQRKENAVDYKLYLIEKTVRRRRRRRRSIRTSIRTSIRASIRTSIRASIRLFTERG